jgi:4-hydroxy-tetrahydrodipicolinate reductase
MSIRVAVHGANGKMGQMVIAAAARENDMVVVGGVDVKVAAPFFDLPDGKGRIPLFTDLVGLLTETKPQVLVDFSVAKAVLPMAKIAAAHHVNIVSGTTGLSADDVTQLDQIALDSRTGIMSASNFAIGAVVMMYLAQLAAQYFDFAEIIEEHHNQKLDAPSGTALTTARMMAQGRGKDFMVPEQKEADQLTRGARVSGISMHSIRLPGIVARQEIIFGALGQTLSIKHDAISRECYMPGVMMAVRKIGEHQGLVLGLDSLLDLK